MRISIGDRLLLNTYVDLFKRQGEWTLFFNVSFRKAASYEWAKKRFKWFLKYLNTKERSFYANFVRCLVFYERHDTTSGSIHIHALTLLDFDLPKIRFHLECSKGTYVRAFCADIGEVLGCGAVLSRLHRTRIGSYSVEQAVKPDEATPGHILPYGP